MTQLLLLLGVAVLVGANGFFVAAEFALVRARRARVEQLREEGRRGAALVLKQIDQIDEYLSACQLGITMASIGIGFLGEPAIAKLLEDALRRRRSRTASSLAISLGARLPDHDRAAHHVRRAGAEDLRDRARRGARRGAWPRPLAVLPRRLQPADLGAQHGLERDPAPASGVDPRAEFEEVSSSEDLKLIIARSAHGGKLDPGEAGMLSGVFHLHEQEARQVMTPIPAVVTVDISEDVETALRRCGRLRPHPPGRDRGRQHRPHQGHRPRELAGAAG